MSQKNYGITLSNDNAREQFFLDYTNEDHGWYLYAEAPQVQRRWWRRDFGEWSIVIEDAVHRTRCRLGHVDEEGRTIGNVYLVEDWSMPLNNSTSYKTRILARLKAETANGNTV